MCKSLFAICVVLVLALVNSVAVGYPDQNDYFIVLGEPVIDGVISAGEWDSADWIEMNADYSPPPPDDLSEARWAAMWSPGTNLIYVAVTGTDTSHNFSSNYGSYNTQDDVEIYIDPGNTDTEDSAYYSNTQRYAQQYFIGPDGSGGAWSHIKDQSADSVLPAGGYAAVVNGDIITYEFALKPYSDLNLSSPGTSPVLALEIGQVVGLDICMVSCDTSLNSRFLCENSVGGKWKLASKLLDLTLVGVVVTAHKGNPSDGQTDVAPDVVLSWKPGEYAAFHDVYFGTDYNDVGDADTSDSTGIYRGRQGLDANSYDTNDYAADGLWPGRTYYWRIDEVNEADPCSPWKGSVFSFTVECDMVVAIQFDFTDLAAFAQQWLVEGGTSPQQGWCCGADLDHSGGVDFLDFALLVQDWLKVQPLGAIYYVDFDTGSDLNSGLSKSQPFKHCPCDDNATGIPAATTLAGGDTVIFKGGVHYRGEIKANSSGDAGSPIVFDGDTAQTWGSGKAVTDGSEPLTGWTPCSSAADCGGASNWANMYKTTLPSGSDDVWVVNLFEGNTLLAVAQGPTAPDPFYYDAISAYNSVPPSDITSTSIKDSSFFTQSSSSAWDGAYAHVWVQGNQVYTSKVTSFNPSTDTIYFQTLSNPPYTRYAMGNSVEVLDAAGEYVVNESSGEVYLWPHSGTSNITVSVRKNGFALNGKSYVTIQGFKIIKFSAGFNDWGNGSGINNAVRGSNYVTIRNNEVAYNRGMSKCAGMDIRYGASNSTIENNYIHRNLRSRGLLVGGSNTTVANNTLVKNGGTGIYMGGASNMYIIGNTVLDHSGMHGNGMTAYQGCSNILFLGNTVLRGSNALTTQCADSITIAYNILHTDTDDVLCVADWTCSGVHSSNLHYYNNVIMHPGGNALYTGGTGLIVKNNIIDGWCGANGSYNIYTSLCWNQNPSYGWYPGDGEIIEEDETKVFVDYANFDYHLKAGSCAIDAGTNVGYSEDIEGNPVPTGSAVDIGAYEF